MRFAERPGTDPAKRPIREIVGVDPRLNQRWSTRRAHINTRRGELAIQFQNDHGRPPTPVEALHLAQQATLETRDAKHEPRSLTEQRTTWLNEAAAVLDGPGAVASMVRTALAPHAATARIVDARWVAQTADHILTVMEASRSTWQMWHVRAEAQRQVRTIDMPAEHAPALVGLLVDKVIDHRSIALVAPADNVAEPDGFGGTPCRSMLRNLDPRLVAELNPHDQSAPGQNSRAHSLCRDHYLARLSCAPGAHRSRKAAYNRALLDPLSRSRCPNPLVEQPFNWFKSPSDTTSSLVISNIDRNSGAVC